MRTIWTPPFVMIMISYWWCTIHFKLLVLSWPFMYSTSQCGVSWPEATRFHEMFYLLQSNSILCVLVKWNATIVCYEDCSCLFLQITKLTLFWCKKKNESHFYVLGRTVCQYRANRLDANRCTECFEIYTDCKCKIKCDIFMSSWRMVDTSLQRLGLNSN